MPSALDVVTARTAIPDVNPACAILDAQFAGSGYWIKPDTGYSPKYRATVWQVVFLAQLGAPPTESIRRACDYVLDHSRRLTDRRGNPDGRFVAGKTARTAINCLNGNLLWALGRFGYGDDSRLVEAREATAQSILKRGFACYYNGDLPCAWGAVKSLGAFVEIPSGDALGYRADVLEAMTALMQAGQAGHPHVQAGVEWLLAKQDTNGRWTLEQVPGKMWSSFGRIGGPNKWVTLRALQLLKAVGGLPQVMQQG